MQKFKSAINEIHNLKSITGAGMLSALNIVINQFAVVIVPNVLEINFTFLAAGICGMMYGPVLAGFAGAGVDIIKYLLRPNGQFFIGFTLNEFLIGFIYGLFFYKQKITVTRVFLARLCASVLVNLLLTPIWLHIVYGKAFIVYASTRVIKNLVMLPVETFLLYVILKRLEKIKIK